MRKKARRKKMWETRNMILFRIVFEVSENYYKKKLLVFSEMNFLSDETWQRLDVHTSFFLWSGSCCAVRFGSACTSGEKQRENGGKLKGSLVSYSPPVGTNAHVTWTFAWSLLPDLQKRGGFFVNFSRTDSDRLDSSIVFRIERR